MPRSDRKTIVIGLATSALIHAGLLCVSGRARVPATHGELSQPVRAFAGSQLIDVVDVTEAAGGTAPGPPADEPVSVRDELDAAGSVERPSLPDAAKSVAARTSAHVGDGRLWRSVTGVLEGLPVAERVGDRIAAKIAPFNDSIVPPERAAERAVDWTVGSDSTRWGYRPGFVYVAGQKRPFTFELAGSPESAARLREWRDARFHLESADMRERIDERARALRKRSDSLRAVRRHEGG